MNHYLILGAVAVSSAISFGAGWMHRHKAALEDDAERAVTAKTTVIKQNVITKEIVTEYKDRIVVIEGKGVHVTEIIEKTAPPADCLWPEYYRRLHDAAARGDDPPSSAGSDDAAKTIDAATAFATIDKNYRICHANSEQLSKMQLWADRISKTGETQ